MRTQSKTRVYSSFRSRVVEATADEARILRQVQRVMEYYSIAAAERARLSELEWKRKAKESIIGELEMLDSTVAGGASWCHGGGRKVDADALIERMMAYDIPKLASRLKGYPQLQRYIEAIRKLREMVVEFLEDRQAALS